MTLGTWHCSLRLAFSGFNDYNPSDPSPWTFGKLRFRVMKSGNPPGLSRAAEGAMLAPAIGLDVIMPRSWCRT